MIYIITGPSGVGKNTIINELFKKIKLLTSEVDQLKQEINKLKK